MTKSDTIKNWIVNRIYDSRFKSKLNPSDTSAIYSLRKGKKDFLIDHNSIPLNEVALRHIYLLEIFHINDFSKLRKGIIKLAKRSYAESGHFGDIDIKKLGSDLESISTAFDQARNGTFIRLNFFKSKFHKTKPFIDATLHYWKTNESFIVVMIKLTPNQSTINKFKDICSNKDESYMSPNFNTWKEILTKKCFLKSQSIHQSKKKEDLEKNLNEFCKPFEKYMRENLCGYFNKIEHKLPRILRAY